MLELHMDIDDLNHSNILTLRSPDTKGTFLSIGVYNGSINFSVLKNDFNTKKISPIIQLRLSRYFATTTVMLWEQLLKDKKPNISRVIGGSEWNKETKKFEEHVLLSYGFKDDLTPYIGVKDIPNDTVYQFVIDKDNRCNLNRTQLTPSEINDISVRNVIEVFKVDIPVAIRLTSFNRKAIEEQREKRRNGYGGNSTNNSGNSGSDNSEFNDTF